LRLLTIRGLKKHLHNQGANQGTRLKLKYFLALLRTTRRHWFRCSCPCCLSICELYWSYTHCVFMSNEINCFLLF